MPTLYSGFCHKSLLAANLENVKKTDTFTAENGLRDHVLFGGSSGTPKNVMTSEIYLMCAF